MNSHSMELALPGEQGRLGTMPSGLLMMWAFLASDVMSFASLIAGYFYLRVQSTAWPDNGELLNVALTSVNTVFLLSSSFTMGWAVRAIRRDDGAGLRRWLAVTMALGALFLTLQVYEYVELTHVFGEAFGGRPFSGHLFASTFFLLTGFHGAHVAAGLIYLGAIFVAAASGRYSRARHLPVEVAALFWHFVDWVWVAIFTSLYLI